MSILEQPLSLGKNTVSLTAFSLLFSEVIQYYQKDVNSYDELEQKLIKFGKEVGSKLHDIIAVREKTKLGQSSTVTNLTQVNAIKLTRQTELLNILIFMKGTVWKSIFGYEADKLEQSQDEDKTYYAIICKK